jgi:hypothetical protein
MRKDNISKEALEAAYLIYAEKGHQIQDYSHAPTDYARGTVLEPEDTSVVMEKYQELTPSTVMDGGEYEMLQAREKEINMSIDSLQNQMRNSRKTGAFQMLQRQMKEMQALVKEKEGIDAKMAVVSLGRKQQEDYNRTMDQTSSYSELLDKMSSRIQELEAKLVEFSESQV